MKYVLAFFCVVSLNAYSKNWIKKEDVTKCDNVTVYLNQKLCGDECISITSDYNCNYYVLVNDNLVQDQVKKTQYELEESQKINLKNAIAQAKKQMQCGKDVIALLSVRNASKDLTNSQMEQMLSTYSLIKSLLDTGALETAKEKISLINPDGEIITQEDINSLTKAIDECK